MLHVPILRFGQPYESVEKVTLVHHGSGEPIAQVSQANSGMVGRDIPRIDDRVLEAFSVADLIAICKRAGELFLNADLPVGQTPQSFDDYARCLSATTGMPITYCRNNARKIFRVMDEMEVVLRGLLRGTPLEVLDRGYVIDEGRMVSFFREARSFGAVLPSNSPGVHSLWIPAIAMKTPIVLKPGREEPWSPLRILEALAAAGIPRTALGFYPTDHGGAGELLRRVSRAMLFGDAGTTRAWAGDPRVELHGPGYSKVVLDERAAENWEQYLDVMVSSIAANGGRSCINASAVYTPKNGAAIAEGLARALASVQALPADDSQAQVAAFANPAVAESISATIDAGLREPGAEDVTARLRGGPRLVRKGRLAWLLPTIVRCDSHEHPLANREFLFPYASVVECPARDLPVAIGPSLVVSAICSDRAFAAALMASSHVDRLNIGPIPTWQISWDQPHEGNLFEHLYRQRAFQIDASAGTALASAG